MRQTQCNKLDLQEFAETLEVIITLNCLPGTFVTLDRAIAYIVSAKEDFPLHSKEKLSKAFIIGNTRSYYGDPRFGLITFIEGNSQSCSFTSRQRPWHRHCHNQ